jgi:hypothetical protein
MKKLIFIIALGSLVCAYQNFGSLTADDLQMAQALKDLKQLNGKEASTSIAVPRSGNSLESVSSDWAQRQSAMILNGADQKLLDTINDKIVGIFKDDEVPAAAANEPVKTGGGRGPASLGEATPVEVASVKFTKINAMEYKSGDTKVNASIETDGAHINYNQTLSENTQIGIGHKSNNSETQFLLNYRW